MKEGHNDAKWFAIANYTEVLRTENRDRFYPERKCWFVVRTCPCHDRVAVTTALESWRDAERVLNTLTNRSLK